MQFCTESKRRKNLKLALLGYENSLKCWRTIRNYIHNGVSRKLSLMGLRVEPKLPCSVAESEYLSARSSFVVIGT